MCMYVGAAEGVLAALIATYGCRQMLGEVVLRNSVKQQNVHSADTLTTSSGCAPGAQAYDWLS